MVEILKWIGWIAGGLVLLVFVLNLVFKAAFRVYFEEKRRFILSMSGPADVDSELPQGAVKSKRFLH